MKPEAPGLVVDDDRLLGDPRHLLPERARELVGGAARRERHDEGDRLVGIFGGGAAGEAQGERADDQSAAGKREHGLLLLMQLLWTAQSHPI